MHWTAGFRLSRVAAIGLPPVMRIVRREDMRTGCELKISDIGCLLSVASVSHRKQLAGLVKARIKKEGGGFRFFDDSGAEFSLSEVHRRSQADGDVQRQVYNLWMFYAR